MPGADDILSLQNSIATLEAQRGLLGDAVVDPALAAMRERLAGLQSADGEQRLRQVSILFLDMVGSTSLVQRLGPEDAHAVLDGVLAAGTHIVAQHGGRVLQYAGDNLLAVFGADEVREDDALRAVRCALALCDDGRRQAERRGLLPGFDVRLGVHTGPVLLGGGVDAEGSIRGHAVHVAARLEQSAPAGAVRISLDTARQVQGRFALEELPPLAAKGVDAPLRSFLVRQERPAEPLQARPGLDDRRVPLVGRETPLAALHAAFAEAGGGQPVIATLLGEAGIGKSRLAAEAVAAWQAAGAQVLAGRHDPDAALQPFGTWRRLLWRAFGLQDSDTGDAARARLREGLAPHFGSRTDEHTALLGQLFGLDFSTSPHVAGIVNDGRQLRARGLHSLGLLLQARAAAGPLVLALDDLHWADEDSLDAVAQVMRALDGQPVLLLATARPSLLERRPDWSAGPARRTIDVGALDDDASDTLARTLLSPLADPPAELHAMLVARAAGNPFHLHALVEMLRDRGVIVDDGGAAGAGWRMGAAPLLAQDLPPTLVGVLQARLDALPAGERRALQQASVVGPEFWEAALPTPAQAALPGLAARGLVQRRDDSAFAGSAEYRFMHHLLHQATYATVLRADRQAGHAAAAHWLAAQAGDRRDELAPRIAEHLERADEREGAAVQWTVAALAAADRHADANAQAHAERARALDDGHDPRRRFALARVRCGVAMRRGDVDAHEAALAEMEAVSEALQDDGLQLIACQARMTRQCLSARYDEAVALGRARLARVDDAEPTERGRCRNVMVVALLRSGQEAEALQVGECARDDARQAGDAVTEGAVLNNIGLVHLFADRLDDAERWLQEAWTVYRRAGSGYGASLVGVNLALIDEKRGNLAQARARAEEVLALCEAVGNRPILALCLGNLAFLACEQGELDTALARAEQALQMARADQDHTALTSATASSALILRALQRWDEALQRADDAAAAYARQGQPDEARGQQALAADLCARLGRHDEALARAQAVLAALGEADWPRLAETGHLLSQVLARHGDPRADAVLSAAHAGLVAQGRRQVGEAGLERFLNATQMRRELLALHREAVGAS